MKTLTKTNIEEFAKEIIAFLEEHELANSVSIYFNNKVMRSRGKYDEEYNYIPYWITEEDIDPHDYFEYAAYDHILSMSFEGALYDEMNYSCGRRVDMLRDLFDKYGVYFELGNAWNLTAYPNDDDMEIEYTKYNKPKLEIHIYRHRFDNPSELQTIMDTWYELSKATGEGGSCVLGAGFSFEWRGDKYFMSACSPYQGSLSWEAHTETIKNMLIKIGATSIRYNWGNMD